MKKIFLTFILAGLFSCNAQNKTKQPNVIFFLVDDFGWMDTSYQGSQFYETPNIDKLAHEGMRFNQAYSAHPRCVPSRFAMITGKYPAREGIPGKGGQDSGKLKSSEFGIAKAFKQEGYVTFFAGKWHLASDEVYPEDEGFDYNFGGGHAGAPKSYFYPYNTIKNNKSGNGKEKNIEGLDDAVEGEYLSDHLTRKTVNFIKENKDKPFFVYLSHYGVHTPFEGKKELEKIYEQKLKENPVPEGPEFATIWKNTGETKLYQDNVTYAAMIQSIDESLGKLNAVLKELNLDENTIIVFTSDHGGLSNRGNNRPIATSNLPLRAGKGHNYEGGIRVPMFVKWPGVTKENSTTDVVITGTDYYPTLVDMANLAPQPQQYIDGVSFSEVLKGNKIENEERAIFWHSPIPRPINTGDTSNTTVRKGDYKLLDFYEDGYVELYNIKNDLGETTNLAESMPEKTKELKQLIVDWRKKVNAYVKHNKKN
ncbi:Arylsulfatase A [Lutibacter agarilyticus]|uniref:Arylsulfatase A n=1 Tax=Lutibacter agarilyticus TaxID=1109740 RepID=A0A238ZAM2_9FLAO|nr:sulfatase [Lutibacter agarilyticus]SNR79843.1 Arylsulfatase A [Lutibacter agarilyticus]